MNPKGNTKTKEVLVRDRLTRRVSPGRQEDGGAMDKARHHGERRACDKKGSVSDTLGLSAGQPHT